MENGLTVYDIIKELNISRAYLYKLIAKENITLEKNNTGRYLWNIDLVNKLRKILSNEKEYNDPFDELIDKLGLKKIKISNRRYLGNKFGLTNFIKKVITNNCSEINSVCDIFSGTGAVSDIFKDKKIITNDLLYVNYLSNYAWFSSDKYDKEKIIKQIYEYNKIVVNEENYVSENFANTFFSKANCQKIGFIRQDIENKYLNKEINYKEYSILITALIYAMDKIANTVGHYDAFRKNTIFKKELVLGVVLPDDNLNINNTCFNEDANKLVKKISCDLLYLDPPYNSRQYSDAYHILENIAKWEKLPVYGTARKMERANIKSKYCLKNAGLELEDLIKNTKAKYILLSYNDMGKKGNARSNAKISDDEIIRILSNKGELKIFEEAYKSFTTGKSNREDNKERLFLCIVNDKNDIDSPFNYTGGKFKLLNQIKRLFKPSDNFLDLFCGGASVGVNIEAKNIICNDVNKEIIGLLNYIKESDINTLLAKINNLIIKYNLSNTKEFGYSHYGTTSSIGLSSFNKDGFIKLRNDYNNEVKNNQIDYVKLYVLIVYSFNNQIRFNSKKEFNLPVGKRDFNYNMQKKLVSFAKKIKEKNITFKANNFKDIMPDNLKDTFVYCDPPYLITNASYNEQKGWTEDDEVALLNWLDTLNKKGIFFALSNVIRSKNTTNDLLLKWIKKNNYQCHYLNYSYSNCNYQRKDKDSNTTEVLITNY